MTEIKLPLWSVGAVVMILSPAVMQISGGNIDWTYLLYFNAFVWGSIGIVELIYNIIKGGKR